MNRVSRLATIAAVLAGCTADTDENTDVTVQWLSELAGTGAWANLTGEALVLSLESPEVFTATAELRNGTAGDVYLWHVHAGSCGARGSVVGKAAAYPPLMIDVEGDGSVTVTLPARLARDSAYHVDVHLSDGDGETVIACGDLVR
jgi:hypothetical protein